MQAPVSCYAFILVRLFTDIEQLADEALRHTAYGSGLVEAVRGELSKFCIQSNDDAGNPLATGGLKLEARCARALRETPLQQLLVLL